MLSNLRGKYGGGFCAVRPEPLREHAFVGAPDQPDIEAVGDLFRIGAVGTEPFVRLQSVPGVAPIALDRWRLCASMPVNRMRIAALAIDEQRDRHAQVRWREIVQSDAFTMRRCGPRPVGTIRRFDRGERVAAQPGWSIEMNHVRRGRGTPPGLVASNADSCVRDREARPRASWRKASTMTRWPSDGRPANTTSPAGGSMADRRHGRRPDDLGRRCSVRSAVFWPTRNLPGRGRRGMHGPCPPADRVRRPAAGFALGIERMCQHWPSAPHRWRGHGR